MSEENTDGRVPKFQLDDAVQRGDRYAQKYIEAQAKYDKLAARLAVDDALAGLPDQADVANLRDILKGSNLRCDGERVIVDYREGDQTLTLSPQEAIQRMQASEAHACLFNRPKPKEPSAQDLHNEKLAKMTPQQYDAYRKRRPGGQHLLPE